MVSQNVDRDAKNPKIGIRVLSGTAFCNIRSSHRSGPIGRFGLSPPLLWFPGAVGPKKPGERNKGTRQIYGKVC